MPLTAPRRHQVLTIVSIVALVMLSGCSGNQKVTFCHHPPGNPDNPQTLTVSMNALPGIANEDLDYQGECRDEAAGEAPPPQTLAGECRADGPCGSFNYTYNAADAVDNGAIGQNYEISTTFENRVNELHKTTDAGNDLHRFEVGVGVDLVNTQFDTPDGPPTGQNTYGGELRNAVIFE